MSQLTDNLKIRLSFVGNPTIMTQAPSQLAESIDAGELRIRYRISVEINRPESKVIINTFMEYLLRQNSLFSGNLTSVFDVVDLASYITEQEGDQFRIENDFLPMLVNIAFSTTRGYFVRELQDSVLAPYPFPMISMDNIKKRITYQLL